MAEVVMTSSLSQWAIGLSLGSLHLGMVGGFGVGMARSAQE